MMILIESESFHIEMNNIKDQINEDRERDYRQLYEREGRGHRVAQEPSQRFVSKCVNQYK
jgi:hypothetical protein